MDLGAAVMNHTPTRPVQVRLPAAIDDFLTGLAHERDESKTQIVIEALECLREQLLERRMDAGYEALARERAGEQDQLVQAGLTAALPALPD
jgi:hypothetical protein